MDFPRFRLLGTRLRTAVVRLRLTDVLLFLLLLLFARHKWANRTPASRYVKYPFGSGEVVLLDTSTGTLYGIDKDGAWRRNLVRAAIAAEEKAAKDAKAVKEAKEAEDAAAGGNRGGSRGDRNRGDREAMGRATSTRTSSIQCRVRESVAAPVLE